MAGGLAETPEPGAFRAPLPHRHEPCLLCDFTRPLCDFTRLSHEVIRSRSEPFTRVCTENVRHCICFTFCEIQSNPAGHEDGNEPSHEGGEPRAVVTLIESGPRDSSLLSPT